jgi:hypothetical protein
VKYDIGAVSSLSNVPVCFSRTTATASIDVVPNRTISEINSGTMSLGFICPAMANARKSETGIRRPYVKFGALK